ncbi:hypothetical protein AMATHDRAFT_61541 [Amanita thiersii Skay4041]|uniref:Glycosyltransferase 61 catalytic domain-containing protein n=1 Tax=Amanita thiersii Skay4041 TaxID=703135 RepID=A0A2A9NR98_9AGAR|nr:hypothetical protein AMATHDRAFT_61541 [Amanita thiersii Skay4041]
MHLWSSLLTSQSSSDHGHSIVINTAAISKEEHPPAAVVKVDVDLDPLPPPLDEVAAYHIEHPLVTTVTTTVFTTSPTDASVLPSDASSSSSSSSSSTSNSDEFVFNSPLSSLLHTSIVAHVPGWTVFRNVYMANGTLYIVSPTSSRDDFPQIRMMTSTGLEAENTPENIALREPTSENMDFLTPEQAQSRWGSTDQTDPYRIWSVEGNTILFNDPPQFLKHYYHFVAELFFGTWAFWHGAWSTSSLARSTSLNDPQTQHPPPIHRAIFSHADEWRDRPGFNAYFLRAAFPSMTIETQSDWVDRIRSTTPRPNQQERAWHFPVLLLTDRSAAHRGVVCGSQTQRTAAEAWEYMVDENKLLGAHAGRWWDSVREAVWKFAGVRGEDAVSWSRRGGEFGGDAVLGSESRGDEEVLVEGVGNGLDVRMGYGQKYLPLPTKIVITYISRQGAPRRKLVQEDHVGLVLALNELVERRREMGEEWELHVVEAEKLSKDEQIGFAANSTIMLGVHGNGLTHLVFMPPTRVSTVIEIFYPGGFAHDYQWTSTALGMKHVAVWNERYRTMPDKPEVAYPHGFQENWIPVYGPTVARIVEDRVDGKL